MNTDKIKIALENVDSAYQSAEIVTDKSEKMNYLMPVMEKLYTELNPNQVTLKNKIIYLNSNQDINDNAYLFQLNDLYREASGTHSACIDTRVDMTIGNGLQPVTPSIETDEFLNQVNRVGDNLQMIWEKVCFDYNLTGMYALQLLYSKEGKVVEILHIDISTVRALAPNDIEFVPIVDTWALSTKWAEIRAHNRLTPNNSAVTIANFNPLTWAKDGGRQLIVNKKYVSGMYAYGLPHYQSVMKYIELDNQLAKFHLGKVSQGFFPNVIVSLAGNPNDDQKAIFKNQFNNRYKGADKEKIMFVWSELGDEGAPKIIPFSTNDDSQVFDLLNKIGQQKILSAHRLQPELASIPKEGSSLGGDANYLNIAYSYTIENVIKPIQKTMLQSLNQIFKLNELEPVTVNNEFLKVSEEEKKDGGEAIVN